MLSRKDKQRIIYSINTIILSKQYSKFLLLIDIFKICYILNGNNFLNHIHVYTIIYAVYLVKINIYMWTSNFKLTDSSHCYL